MHVLSKSILLETHLNAPRLACSEQSRPLSNHIIILCLAQSLSSSDTHGHPCAVLYLAHHHSLYFALLLSVLQVAALTVVDLAGKHCQEVVVCAHVRSDWPHNDPALLCLEATLMVLEDPAAAEQGPAPYVDPAVLSA